MAPAAFRSRGADFRLVAPGGDDDPADAAFEVGNRCRKAEHGHDLGSDRDVEARLAGITIGRAAERAHDLAQGPVVHVHDAAPGDAARIDAELVAPVDVVVDHRREQVMGRRDGVEIAGEMQVDVLHGQDLGIAAAGSPTLHAEARPKGRFAQADHRLPARRADAVGEADRRRGLALPGRGGIDRGHENEFSGGLLAEAGNVLQIDFRLGMAVGNEVLVGNAQFPADLQDRLHFASPRNLDVALDLGHGAQSPLVLYRYRTGRDMRLMGYCRDDTYGPFPTIG